MSDIHFSQYFQIALTATIVLVFSLTLSTTTYAGLFHENDGGFLGRTAGSKQEDLSGIPAARTYMDVSYGQNKKQTYDVYIPQNAQNAPILLMVHGGAWMFGDKQKRGVIRSKAEHWLSKGFVVISTNYRLVPEVSPYGQAQDVANAMADIQKKAPQWGANPSKLILMGHSSGAHVVALINSDTSIAKTAGVIPWAATIPIDSAALNIVELMSSGDQYRFYNKAFGKDPTQWKKTSPYHQMRTPAPPMLLVCSSKRRDGSCERAEQYAAKAKKIGLFTQVLPVALGHGSISSELGNANTYTETVDAFIDAALR